MNTTYVSSREVKNVYFNHGFTRLNESRTHDKKLISSIYYFSCNKGISEDKITGTSGYTAWLHYKSVSLRKHAYSNI